MSEFRWQYFGSRTGLLRISPSLQGVLSADYDPRQQSWYTSSSMPALNAVIIIDTSASMNGSRYLVVIVLKLTCDIYFPVSEGAMLCQQSVRSAVDLA